MHLCGRGFQPTLPLRGATPSGCRGGVPSHEFQPTLPLRGATSSTSPYASVAWFQPTLPLRGATEKEALWLWDWMFQPTLPLRGATGLCEFEILERYGFNPRSPCGERHRLLSQRSHRATCFNPRSPCGERRHRVPSAMVGDPVSTHAPLAGSDALLGA